MGKRDFFLYEVDKERKIATLTFNKPEKLNGMSIEQFGILGEFLQEPQWDDNVKVLIFKGAGRAFGVGDDLSNFLYEYKMTTEDGKPIRERAHQRDRLTPDDKWLWGPHGVFQTLCYFNKATIAQVHGYCYGGHMSFALGCDITIAAEETFFTHAGYRMMGPSAEGLVLPMFLNLGIKKSMELMLTGKPFTAEEAEKIGMVNKVVPLDKLEAEVQRYAEAIALLSLDGIVVGHYAKAIALDRLGFGGVTAAVAHNLGTHTKWDPGDFNMVKELAKGGVKGAIKERERRYARLGMDLETVKKEYYAKKKASS